MVGRAECRTDKYAGAYVHLSDGGHFENLALYELIRRHCRYIIVSDAGEDQELAFTDLGGLCVACGRISAWRSRSILPR